jgi:hypothetical protein
MRPDYDASDAKLDENTLQNDRILVGPDGLGAYRIAWHVQRENARGVLGGRRKLERRVGACYAFAPGSTIV